MFGSGFFVLFLIAVTPARADIPPFLADRSDAPSLRLVSPVDGLNLEELGPLAPVQPADVLGLLRQEFSIDYADNRRIEAERNWYLKHPDYLQRVLTRAQLYMPYIRDELARRGLPVELALLPIVESAYDPFAYSHGRAAGLWQMIPGTAKRFGVRQNWWYDGRRDIVDSTRAALDYLTYLYELNDGDWLNAIASYNSGEGNVLKAVRRNRQSGKPVDFWHLKVPRETASYVPKLLALVDIVRTPDSYQLSLPAIPNLARFEIADVETQIDLALAAELAGIDVDTVYAYNPGYNRWATDPAGPFTLLIPTEAAELFTSTLASVPEAERIRWKRHKIGNGETISEIAEQYHTTAAAIRDVNKLRGNTIRAGQYLMIPASSKPLSSYSKSADARLAKTQDRKRDGQRIEHIVASGESFWTISRQYKVTTRQLAAWNGMAPGDTLSTGKTLVVWTNAANATTAGTLPTSAPVNTTRKLRYTVRSGDSLYLIAQKFRVSIGQIAAWNNIDTGKILRPGQRLTMYVDVTRQSS
ncbi:MAG TPA: LysM peptidoglycan-binding domain-containing protein [Woeseiaceae bacterium]|nr:LysM peptidoglycan-binding domain-containing protein [Woeseiaceae bacterium]